MRFPSPGQPGYCSRIARAVAVTPWCSPSRRWAARACRRARNFGIRERFLFRREQSPFRLDQNALPLVALPRPRDQRTTTARVLSTCWPGASPRHHRWARTPKVEIRTALQRAFSPSSRTGCLPQLRAALRALAGSDQPRRRRSLFRSAFGLVAFTIHDTRLARPNSTGKE